MLPLFELGPRPLERTCPCKRYEMRLAILPQTTKICELRKPFLLENHAVLLNHGDFDDDDWQTWLIILHLVLGEAFMHFLTLQLNIKRLCSFTFSIILSVHFISLRTSHDPD